MLIYMMMLETPEEKSLFEQIYLEYRGLMFHVAYEILHNEQDAEDAVHHAASCHGKRKLSASPSLRL